MQATDFTVAIMRFVVTFCVLASLPVLHAFSASFASFSVAPRTAMSGPSFLPLRPARKQCQVASLRMMADSDWYKMEKLEDLEGGAARYKFTVDVDAQLSKDSYGELVSDTVHLCRRILCPAQAARKDFSALYAITCIFCRTISIASKY